MLSISIIRRKTYNYILYHIATLIDSKIDAIGQNPNNHNLALYTSIFAFFHEKK
jgi:hypothetical protein